MRRLRNFSEHQLCGICTDESRNSSGTLCIVEEVTDCMAIEKSGSYKGNYHVLGGVLNPMLGVGRTILGSKTSSAE